MRKLSALSFQIWFWFLSMTSLSWDIEVLTSIKNLPILPKSGKTEKFLKPDQNIKKWKSKTTFYI